MFAVIKTGGKQYKVAAGGTLEIERLSGEAGDAVAFEDVLVVGGDSGVTLGSPLVAGASVAAEIVAQTRGDRILVFKKRRRQNSKRSHGHRQDHTLVRITEILTDGKKASAAPKARAKPEAKAKEAKPAEAAAPAEKPAAEAPKAAAKAPEAKAAPAKAATEADNLKQLSGVGPVIEKKLHGLGITTFAEIAAWTAEDVARFDEALSFKGRIERDDWIGQAKKLAAGEE
jgi:large subunit ribosomal protein L21